MTRTTRRIVTTLVALLAAGGGAVAWWQFLSPTRIGIYAAADAGSGYNVANHANSYIHISPSEGLETVLSRDPTSASAVASITFDVTNLGTRSFSAHQMTFEFDEILPGSGRRLVLWLNGDLITEIDLQSKGFDATIVRSEGKILTLDVRSAEPIEDTIERMKEAFQHRIKEIVLDDLGDTHSSAFLRSDSVTFILSPEVSKYEAPVSLHVTPNDTVQVPVRFGAEFPVRASGRIVLRYNSNKERNLVEDFRIDITPAPLVDLVTEERSN